MALRWESQNLDTFDFYLPESALTKAVEHADNGPTERDGGPEAIALWQQIDDWLVRLGRYIYAAVPFRFAAVGYETLEDEIDIDHVSPLPEKRYRGYLLPRDHELTFIPATL